NGVPYVLLKTIFDLDPNDRNPALRTIARIWKRQASVPDASGGEAWTMDHIGISPRPNDYDNGVARPAGPAALPYGFAFENPHTPCAAQYDQQKRMQTGDALVKSGFDGKSRGHDTTDNVGVSRDAVQALYGAMIDEALQHPEALYGNSPGAIARGKLQTLAVA